MITRRDVHHLILAAGAAACVPNAAAAAPAYDKEPLDAYTRSVLMASAEAVTGIRPLRGYYDAYYQHQSLHRSGYCFLYREYARVADRIASRAGRQNFLACDSRERSAIIAEIRALPRVWQLFEIPIFQETLAVFERTDAWLQLGYVSWPGSPRSLDDYRQPFQGRRSSVP